MTPAFTQLRDELRTLVQALPEPVQLMEVCGTHTMAVFRHGLRSLWQPAVRLVSGPGCPVCVTGQAYIDAAVQLAGEPGVTIATYGDLVRVPGAAGSLEQARAAGARVVVVRSAERALALARAEPGRQVVFLAVGFETTAPATAAVVQQAAAAGATNFSVLMGHKLVVPALQALLAAGDARVQGFLCPGHVSVIIGAEAYKPLAAAHGRPCVVAGFEPAQIVEGVVRLLRQLQAGRAEVENAYPAVVRPGGNAVALALLERVFEPVDAVWRALGTIPASGLALRPAWAGFDAARRFDLTLGADVDPPGCRCGDVIQGKLDPPACALFGEACTPRSPVGPCMVSSEGACAAWYKYGHLALEPA